MRTHVGAAIIVLSVHLVLAGPDALPAQTAGSTAPSSIVPFLYELELGDARAYLYGSIHLADDDATPPPRVVRSAFGASDVLVTELPMDTLESGAAAFQLAARGMLPEGRTLRDIMTPDQLEIVHAALALNGYPTWRGIQVAPWLLRMSLSANTQDSGITAQDGLDLYFYHKAESRGMEQRALESVEEQIGYFADVPLEEQVELLIHTVENPEPPDAAATVYSVWRSGDEQALYRLMLAEYTGPAAVQAEYDRIFIERNRSFAQRIAAMMENEHVLFVVVGAGHLVGDESVQELLVEAGATYRRLQ